MASTALDRFRLDGQVAVITGGARGIGRATAEAFVAAGARAVLVDRDLDEARKAASAMSNAEAHALDVTLEAEVDLVDHYALVAVLARCPDVIVGVGRWVRDAETPAEAEIAIVIADDLQGRGVGTILGAALADAARDRGIERFTASMLPTNRAAHRLFAKIASQMQLTHRGGVDELIATLRVAA